MKRFIIPRNWVPCLCLSLAVWFTGCGKSKRATAADNPAAGLEVSNKLAAIAAAGEPVTLDALNQWYVQPPRGRNAAEIYVQAMQVLTADEPRAPAFLSRNQRVLALLLQGASLTSARYPIDLRRGVATQLPHLARIRKCAFLLQSEAVSEAGRDHMDAAAKAVVAGVRLARSLENEPVIISRLVEISSLTIALQGLEQTLSRHAFADGDLRTIQTVLRDAEASSSFERVLVGERCFAISHFQTPAPELVRMLSQDNTEAGTLQNVDLAAYIRSPVFQQDFNFTLDYFSNLLAIAQMPFPDCLHAQGAYGSSNGRPAVPAAFILSRMLLPDLGKLPTKAAEAAARVRIARTVIAVERYRLKHQQALPASLDALTPEYLGAVPNDPFTGQPLRYQVRSSNGYIVYSVGRNRTDNHGSTQPTSGTDSSPLDLVFTVQR